MAVAFLVQAFLTIMVLPWHAMPFLLEDKDLWTIDDHNIIRVYQWMTIGQIKFMFGPQGWFHVSRDDRQKREDGELKLKVLVAVY